ncbi:MULTISPECIES: precorrin-2 C(20)-methyltransferase [unclassified Oceanispirochaeta]|uniref:precorrin-2 C(20)-methyltransferase n=1 Tax=unclassified Oceanispirochaeta TaxID=2635722 RepID=UPI000E09A559|nr:MULTISPECIES: precorrin-2 C(20)-methyltransferase [unclassified Oceanispirochaeta]MBF9014810.1 precorrin-2 C(20)-methyltransferase [Oceanispirochaeta sp. M2]NPD71066.1 precorrin-2 C(20)-methyltransferase [Oceanispirochaeta sp. M1]RDG33899.1 precorrin-2 C(20)-methyltransferase [Oceanispirochaeta sp. M1]
MIYLIGMGPGGEEYLTPLSRQIIQEADRVYAFPKHIEMLGLSPESSESIQGEIPGLPERLGKMDQNLRLAVLVSGNPQVFSLSRRFIRELPRERWTLVPGIGSDQVMGTAMGLQTPLPALQSLHGHPVENLLPQLYKQESAFIYTDSENNPRSIASYMAENQFRNWRFTVGQNLGTADQSIEEWSLEDLLKEPEDKDWGLNLLYIAPLEESLRRKGYLYGIGIGPGDPELISLKAMRILKQSDVILAPRSSWKKGSIAREILEQAAGKDLPFQEMIYPMSEDRGTLDEHWATAAGECEVLLKEGKQVSFITLGDPSLFSTFSYLCEALDKIMPEAAWEIIPGISSIQLAAARLGLPLALGKDKCCIMPTPDNMEDLKPLLEIHESIVLMKVGKRLEDLKEFLKRENLAEKAAFIRRAGFREEYKAYDMNELDESRDGYLSIVMIRPGRNR